MMRRKRSSHHVVFLDLIMNALLCFTALFILAYVQIRPEAQDEPALKTEGKFVVIMQWPDDSQDDVDLYVMDPAMNVSFFQSRDVGLMHLEHDDLGTRNDVFSSGSGDIRVARNEERTILREVIPGEYVVNVHMYSKRDPGPTEVVIALFRLRGKDAEMVTKKRILTNSGSEETAFRFTVDKYDVVSNINELPTRFAARAAGRTEGGP